MKFTALFILCLTIFSCGQDPLSALPDNSACENTFFFNRKLDDKAKKERPYFQTCGLSVAGAKMLQDVYLKDMSVNQTYVDNIYDELEITHKILSENNIPYFAIGGTLLGAIRNGGLIPADDDMDLGFFAQDEDAILKLALEFEGYGYELNSNDFAWAGLKVYKKGAQTNGLDLFPYKKRLIDGQERYALAREDAFKSWPMDYFELEALDKLSLINFAHLKIYSAPLNYSIKALDRVYGSDWYTHTYKIYDHVQSRPARAVKEALVFNEYYHLKHSQH